MKELTIKMLIFAILGFFSASCSLFQYVEKDSSPKYVQKNDLSYSSHHIKKQLKRKTTMAGGQYEISLWPYTYSYITSLTREISSLRSLQSSESQKLFDRLEKNLLKNKTCFQFNYNVERFEEVKNIESWELVLNLQDTKLELKWKNDEIEKPLKSHVVRSQGELPTWSQRAIGCVDQSLELEKGFSVVVRPKFVQWPFSSSTELEWIFDEIITNEKGKKVIKKKKKKTYQNYRGY